MMTTMTASLRSVPAALAAVSQLFDSARGTETVPSWRGFLDYPFLLSSLGSLLLATALAALVAFHPTTLRTVNTFEEAQLPKVHIMYAVIGAVIGVMVLRFGLVVGVVVFGIGGLIRFRTDTRSTRDTGRLIVVTLVGLTTGLGLPHFAVLTALFAFGLIYVLDGRPICRVVIKELPDGKVVDAASAYRAILIQEGCAIMSERKAFAKRHVSFVFRAPRGGSVEALQGRLAGQVLPDVRGELDWELE